MRLKPFNPDKELKKTNRKYTKKQLITTLLVLVVMITIGSSYAIFSIQPEYHTFVKSQVGEFSTGDIKLSVLVEGVAQSDFPAKGTGYSFEKVECENGSTGTWDATSWQLTLSSKGPDKCTINFSKKRIISFTINDESFGAEYEAEEGMTWEEFINSEYNLVNFYHYCGYENGYIVRSVGAQVGVVKYNGQEVYGERIINDNDIYTLSIIGGGCN